MFVPVFLAKTKKVRMAFLVAGPVVSQAAGRGAQLGFDPGLEAVQVWVLVGGEEPVVDEQCPEVVGCLSCRITLTVEAFLSQWSRTFFVSLRR